MRHELAAGVAAGAAGTVALNAATYLDMVVRGRPASTLPGAAAGKLADLGTVDLGDADSAPNRREGLGALLGIVTGVGVGAVYGLVRLGANVPAPLAALGLAGAAMTASDLPMTALGLTDPRRWSASSWIADLLPHLAYGSAAAAAYELFDRGLRRAPGG